MSRQAGTGRDEKQGATSLEHYIAGFGGNTMTTQRRGVYAVGLALVAMAAGACSMPASGTDAPKAAMADTAGSDWTTYHGTYQSWHYSPLTQINTDNVNRLRVAWTHHPGRSTRGLQSMPLVSDGVLY
jgi:glucose dehydrogenase